MHQELPNVITAVSYIAIGCAIVWSVLSYYRGGRRTPPDRLIRVLIRWLPFLWVLYGLFILLCGLHHVWIQFPDAGTRVVHATDWAMAFVSVAAAILTCALVPLISWLREVDDGVLPAGGRGRE